MDAIRTAALAAVAELGAGYTGQQQLIHASKLVCERTGCDLRTAIEAVNWAVERPPAATLPVGSVVAAVGGAFFKEENSTNVAAPWGATHVNAAIHDDHIDELVRSGRATILRVGSGAS